MFNMWLDKNRSANLLSLNECDGFRVTYDLYWEWFVTFPDGGVLKFKRYVGVCKGFPYVYLANLQDHIVTTHKSKMFLKKVVDKIKSIMDIPKKQGVTMVQTVRKNMEGFTKRNIQGAYLAHK